ncbi:MAG: hypothetical protein IJY05_03110 [Clostridia bacterium]|nr:hypothetical protein [Clostridia bacterium]
MTGYIIGFIIGILFTFFISQNVIEEDETQCQGKRIDELTDKELSSIYKEVNGERLRRLQAKENAPFREFEEEDKHE